MLLEEEWGEAPFDELKISRGAIYMDMGSGKYRPDEEMMIRIEETIYKISRFCKPKYGYRVFLKDSSKPDSIVLEGVRLEYGNIIGTICGESDYECLFMATTGAEFQQYMEEEAASGDILREFVSNNIGSEIVEAVTRYCASRLKLVAKHYGFGIGNSYSPGYCGWSLVEQRKLFSLMDNGHGYIRLTDSCLMIPIKSVSGIIPVGPGIIKKNYSCAVCTRTDCYKNRNKVKKTNYNECKTMD